MNLIKCDIAVIGGGAGGLSVAAGAAQFGAKVVLIENNKMGGDCLNYGCVPSKSLLAAAKLASVYKQSANMGISITQPSIDFPKVMDYVASVIHSIAPNDSIERFTGLGVTVIQASPQFIDKQTLIAGETTIIARRIVIATGSSPNIPPIPGLAGISYFTNETIFNLRQKPEHLIIIGGGPIGCELAQAFHDLQVKVTIIEAFSILPKDEPELVAEVREQFIKQGLTLHEETKIQDIHYNIDSANEIVVEIDKDGKHSKVSGSHILVATGRRPNIQDLALDKGEIVFSPKGILVDPYLRTSNTRVYAIGDVTGGFQFTHIANYHAGIVLKNILFRLYAKVDYRAVPWVTYIQPELAHVGLSNENAIRQHQDAKVLFMNLDEIDRAHADNKLTGMIKLSVTRRGKVLGVSILAPNAGELILPWAMLIREGKTLRNLTDLIVPYPTYNEISKRIAGEFYKPVIFSKKIRWLVKLLSYFG